MNRSLCDQVMMHVPSQEDAGFAFPSELLTHIEACPDCRALVDTKIAVIRLMSTVRIDPIVERRLQVHIQSRSRTAQTGNRQAYAPLFAVASAAFSLVLLVSVGSAFLFPAPSKDETVPSRSNTTKSEPALATAVQKSPSFPRSDSVETAARDKSLILSQGASLWMKKGTDMEVLNDTEHLAKTRMKTGRIIVDIRRHPMGFRFVVETPSAEVEALGTVFSVAVAASGEETVRVVESAVVVRPKNGKEPVVVSAGEQLILGISAAAKADEEDLQNDLALVRSIELPEADVVPNALPAPALSPKLEKLVPMNEATTAWTDRVAAAIEQGALDEAELLLKQASGRADDEQMRLMFKLAGAYRSRRQYDRTVSVYEHLVAAYPERDATINTLVSIAQIKQGFLRDPAGAIFYYDKYLKKRPHGVLAEAASAGKVRALFNLRQWQDVLEASDLYLHAFPSGISSTEMRQKESQAQKQLDEVL